MKLSDLKKDLLHHAYLVHGAVNNLTLLKQGLASLFEIDLVGNPDVFIREFDTMLVGDAREVVDFASRSALITGKHKIICIVASVINSNAQNALLKTLEEPTKNTHIFILTPNAGALLPTVLSRCMQVEFNENVEAELLSEEVRAFVDASVSERLEIVAKLAKKDKDKKVDKAKLLALLSGMEAYLNANRPTRVHGDSLGKWQEGVQAVFSAKEYLQDKGAMSKMLMESVALVIE